ncbi:MAG: N-acetyl-gamma-glutamyl-phosphate reductase [Clostridiales bacterium]|nr:N-acetyl-gamma-glutamyl-phosphate reductase [Clostridiales bacterium]
MKKKVFIDGSAGTTGLRIAQRLANREDLELLTIPDDKRKDVTVKKQIINTADVVFLCLPDAVAVESVALVENPDTVVIDASTAHRTLPDWAYGFPQLGKKFADKLKTSKRIAVPGCHASGFIALVYPLIEAGILDKDALLTCHSLTGYSGGGKNMIAEYESEDRNALLNAPRQYALAQQHKHLKEMKAITGLENAPAFCPIVGDFYSGMLVTVPLFTKQIHGGIEDIKRVYAEKYQSETVRYQESADENGFLSALALSGKDCMRVTVSGNEERILLMAVYDNLGKGASGAAVECMNTVIGVNEKTGLEL